MKSGWKHSEKTKQRMSLSHKGHHYSPKTEFKKGTCGGENHTQWKGNAAGYDAIHMWIINHYGNPMKCQMCGDDKQKIYHWANKSGFYNRDIIDWIRLCRKCHKKFDKPFRVAIIGGAGKVGSSLAFILLFNRRISTILLDDIDKKKLEAEINDLNAASILLRKRIHVKKMNAKSQQIKFFIICAGFSRGRFKDMFESDESLFELNKPIVSRLLKRFSKERCIIVTNPSNLLGKYFGVKYIGDDLDKIRVEHGLMSGIDILKLKGFTNWGVCAEVYSYINKNS